MTTTDLADLVESKNIDFNSPRIKKEVPVLPGEKKEKP